MQQEEGEPSRYHHAINAFPLSTLQTTDATVFAPSGGSATTSAMACYSAG